MKVFNEKRMKIKCDTQSWIQGKNGMFDAKQLKIHIHGTQYNERVFIGAIGKKGKEIIGGLEVDAMAFEAAAIGFLEHKGLEVHEKEFLTTVFEIAAMTLNEEAGYEDVAETLDLSDEALMEVQVKLADILYKEKSC